MSKWIEENRQLDLMVLGAGLDGDFAFHFPGTPLDTGVHFSTIPEYEIEKNNRYWDDGTKISGKGYTLGAANFNDANKIMVLVDPPKIPIMHQAYLAR
jgi:6-phosphogluconolactonase/glucosamine-6-phosphate isomerase/deaminase